MDDGHRKEGSKRRMYSNASRAEREQHHVDLHWQSGSTPALHSQLVELYDQLGPPDDVPYWFEFSQSVPGSTLYVGPGTGRRAVELARLGVEVCTVEADTEMAAKFWRRLVNEPAELRDRVRLNTLRLEEFMTDEQFGTIMVPNILLNYEITETRAQVVFLEKCRSMSRCGGKIGIELYNPYFLMQEGTVHLRPAEEDSSSALWIDTVIYKYRVDIWAQRCNSFRLVHDVFLPGGKVSRYVDTGSCAVAIFPRELSLLLERCGYSEPTFVSTRTDRTLRREDITFQVVATAI